MGKVMDPIRWTDPRLDKITFMDLQLILDAWHVTQCEGKLKNGKQVKVILPFRKLPRYGFRRVIIKFAKADGVYAVGLGIFDAIK